MAWGWVRPRTRPRVPALATPDSAPSPGTVPEAWGAVKNDDQRADNAVLPAALVTMPAEIDIANAAPAPLLAQAYHQRWEHETGNAQLKTYLRGPGRVLRSKSPDMVRQEIYGYLLTHYAISALICKAATETGVDPDRVKFKRTVRIVRRQAADPAAFPP